MKRSRMPRTWRRPMEAMMNKMKQAKLCRPFLQSFFFICRFAGSSVVASAWPGRVGLAWA